MRSQGKYTRLLNILITEMFDDDDFLFGGPRERPNSNLIKKSLLTTTVNEFQNYHGDGKWVYKITKAVLVKDLVVTLFLIKQFYLLI